MAGNGSNGNGDRATRHLSLLTARLPVGTIEIMSDDGKPKTVPVWPPSIGAQEDYLVYLRGASQGSIDYLDQLRAVRRIAKDCVPDATETEIGRLRLEEGIDLVSYAMTTGNEVEQAIAERRAKANPPRPAGQTRKGQSRRG